MEKKKKLDISGREARKKVIVLFVLFNLICFGLIWLNYKNYSDRQKKFLQEKKRLGDLEKDAQAFQELIERYKDERAHLEALLFTEKDIAEFLDKMSEFAVHSQIRIVDMKAQRMSVVKPMENINSQVTKMRKSGSPEEEEKGPTLVFMPIKLSIEGEFERVIEFLISLEQYRQLLTLSGVTIKRGVYPLLNCSFTLRLYTLKQIETIVQ